MKASLTEKEKQPSGDGATLAGSIDTYTYASGLRALCFKPWRHYAGVFGGYSQKIQQATSQQQIDQINEELRLAIPSLMAEIKNFPTEITAKRPQSLSLESEGALKTAEKSAITCPAILSQQLAVSERRLRGQMSGPKVKTIVDFMRAIQATYLFEMTEHTRGSVRMFNSWELERFLYLSYEVEIICYELAGDISLSDIERERKKNKLKLVLENLTLQKEKSLNAIKRLAGLEFVIRLKNNGKIITRSSFSKRQKALESALSESIESYYPTLESVAKQIINTETKLMGSEQNLARLATSGATLIVASSAMEIARKAYYPLLVDILKSKGTSG